MTINTYRESSLHLALKDYFAQPDGQTEQLIDNCIVDVVKRDLLIEIQTKNFTAIRTKLEKLLTTYNVRLIYPIPLRRDIVKLDTSGYILGRQIPSQRAYHAFIQ